jgi:NAD(P)-dependent dehydrogenase (short-subunit alcohol dehydrogenase family)
MTRTAVVTGAGSGVGRAAAQALAARGLHVVCVGRRLEPLRETVESLGDGQAVSADVATEDGVATVHEAVAGDSIATLVHAAGIEGLVTLVDTDRATFDALVATNLGGPLFLTQALLPEFEDGGSVVFVGSVAAVRGRDHHAAYGATKAGLLGLTVNLAAELAPRVRVNCVCLGAIRTPMLAQALADYTASVGETKAWQTLAAERPRMLLGVAEPELAACSIVHLALDAGFTTGSVLYADGGYTAR